MKIAVLGTRGIPTIQGGVERHVEELYSRLAQRHDVTVYCRNSYTPPGLKEYKGIKIRRLPHIDTKHLDAITHTFLAALDTLARNYDIVHFHSIGPSLLSFMPLLRPWNRPKVVVTIHALDWQQKKWGFLARKVLKAGVKSSMTFADKIITVSNDNQTYLSKAYGCQASLVSNGINKPVLLEPSLIMNFGLEKKNYILFLGRLIPNKNCDLLIRVFKTIKTKLRLVIAGSASHTNGHYQYLKKLALGDNRIIFTDSVSGNLLYELYTNAYAYVLPSNHEGLPITLLEAISYGLPTLCSDIAPNLEIIDEYPGSALVFKSDDVNDFREKLKKLIYNQSAATVSNQAHQAMLDKHDWNKIVCEVESLYSAVFR